MHKKIFFLLIIMVALAGLLFLSQIKRFRKITVTRNPTPLISEKSIFIPVSETDPIFGNPGAPITVIEFVDFNCEQCVALHNTIKNFVISHPQEIRLVWKDAPRPKLLSKESALANRMGWCVFQQDTKKFWQFADAAAQDSNANESELKNIAQGLAVNMDTLSVCAAGKNSQEKINESLQIMKDIGLKSLPVIFVNNKLINTREDISIQDMLEGFIKK